MKLKCKAAYYGGETYSATFLPKISELVDVHHSTVGQSGNVWGYRVHLILWMSIGEYTSGSEGSTEPQRACMFADKATAALLSHPTSSGLIRCSAEPSNTQQSFHGHVEMSHSTGSSHAARFADTYNKIQLFNPVTVHASVLQQTWQEVVWSLHSWDNHHGNKLRASASGLWPFLSCGFSIKYIHSFTVRKYWYHHVTYEKSTNGIFWGPIELAPWINV